MSDETREISVRLISGRGKKVHVANLRNRSFMTLCGWWGNLTNDEDAGEEIITCKNCLRCLAAPYRVRTVDK